MQIFFDEKLLRRRNKSQSAKMFPIYSECYFEYMVIVLLECILLNLLPPKKHQQQNFGRADLFSLFKDLAAKYAAVASKSMVESSFSSNKQDSIDSMVPEPFSNGSTSGP